MTLHNKTSIYEANCKLMACVLGLTSKFSRNFRATLGQGMNEDCIEIGVCIMHANAAQGISRVSHIDTLLELVERTQLKLRMSFDLRLIGPKEYSNAVELTGHVSRQAGGWRKQSAASPVTTPSRGHGQCDSESGHAPGP